MKNWITTAKPAPVVSNTREQILAIPPENRCKSCHGFGVKTHTVTDSRWHPSTYNTICPDCNGRGKINDK